MLCQARNTFVAVAVILIAANTVLGQFAPVAGLPGTTAIPAGSSCFVEWASGCTVVRGPMNIADTTLGYATAGADSDALGPSDDYTVSLGDGGTATVTFKYPIYNGPGFDFAVFENGFMTNDSNMAFLELGFVEVSSDGINFFRFPAITHVEDTLQLSNDGSMDGGRLYDFAGKYIARYGTPFDLEELADTPGLDVNNVTYVRIVDVVGSIDSAYGTRDSKGTIVNDPWPTPFATCGFDLDAVGVINAKLPSAVTGLPGTETSVYPNPVNRGNPVMVETQSRLNSLQVYDVRGRLAQEENFAGNSLTGTVRINTSSFEPGVYFITGTSGNAHFTSKLVVE